MMLESLPASNLGALVLTPILLGLSAAVLLVKSVQPFPHLTLLHLPQLYSGIVLVLSTPVLLLPLLLHLRKLSYRLCPLHHRSNLLHLCHLPSLLFSLCHHQPTLLFSLNCQLLHGASVRRLMMRMLLVRDAGVKVLLQPTLPAVRLHLHRIVNVVGVFVPLMTLSLISMALMDMLMSDYSRTL